MQFVRDKDWLQTVRVTGPAHNLLGLKLGASNGRAQKPEMVILGGAGPIDSDEVARQVLEGVQEENRALGTSLSVLAIRYVRSDTPSKTVYRQLARSLVRHLASEGGQSLAANA
jgi:hypothetical protein